MKYIPGETFVRLETLTDALNNVIKSYKKGLVDEFAGQVLGDSIDNDAVTVDVLDLMRLIVCEMDKELSK